MKQEKIANAKSTAKRHAGESTKVKTKDIKDWIWTYFDDTIKVFVPKEFKSEFDLFMRENRGYMKFKECATYKYSQAHAIVKKAGFTPIYREGKDYVTSADHRVALTEWYKKIIKGT